MLRTRRQLPPNCGHSHDLSLSPDVSERRRPANRKKCSGTAPRATKAARLGQLAVRAERLRGRASRLVSAPSALAIRHRRAAAPGSERRHVGARVAGNIHREPGCRSLVGRVRERPIADIEQLCDDLEMRSLNLSLLSLIALGACAFDVVAIDAKSDIYLCDAMPYHPFFRIGNYSELSEDQILLKRYSHSFCRVCKYPRREATDADTHRLVRAIEARTGRISRMSDQMGNDPLSIDTTVVKSSAVRYLSIDHTPELSDSLKSVSDSDILYIPTEREQYFKAGYDAFKICQNAVGKWTPRRVMDFGIGYGRVARWFRHEWPNSITYGIDINADALSFSERSFDIFPIQMDTHLSVNSIPSDMDLIFCGSLLTGLDEWQWDALIRMVVPALGPSGILVITTHGRAMSQMLRDNTGHFGESIDGSKLLNTFEREGFAYAPYATDHPTFGVSLSSPAWVMSKLEQIPELKIISFEEQGWGQDVVVLKRNPWPMAVAKEASQTGQSSYQAGRKAANITALAGIDDRIEISIAGRTVRVPAGVDRETLRSVVAALTSPSAP